MATKEGKLHKPLSMLKEEEKPEELVGWNKPRWEDMSHVSMVTWHLGGLIGDWIVPWHPCFSCLRVAPCPIRHPPDSLLHGVPFHGLLALPMTWCVLSLAPSSTWCPFQASSLCHSLSQASSLCPVGP
eukprot:Gb_23440 [translate_table: standard]